MITVESIKEELNSYELRYPNTFRVYYITPSKFNSEEIITNDDLKNMRVIARDVNALAHGIYKLCEKCIDGINPVVAIDAMFN